MSPIAMPSSLCRNVCSPGSTSPERVPITRPCSGVRPIEVSTATPPWIADAEQPLPEVQHDLVELATSRPQELGGRARDVAVRGAVEAVAADPVPLGQLRGIAYVRAAGRQGGEEGGVEDRDVRDVGTARGPPRSRPPPPGCAAGPAGSAPGSRRGRRRRSTTGSEKSGPPWTTRCPTATQSPAVEVDSASPSWSVIGCDRGRVVGDHRVPGVLADPLDVPLATTRPGLGATSWYFSDDEPAFRTSTRASLRCAALRAWAWTAVIATVLTMSSTRRPAGQVVDRFAQPLQHRADRDRVGAALYRLVGVVAGVQVGEDEHGRAPGHLRARQLGPGHVGVDRRVVLDRTLEQQVRRPLGDQGGRRPDLARRRRPTRTRRWSRTASPPAARCRTGAPSLPRRSRCRPAARSSGSGMTAQSP